MIKIMLWMGIAAISFWSGCAKENVIGSKRGAQTDTLVIRDTIVVIDHDTLRISIGKPTLILFGTVTSYLSGFLDSAQASLSAFSGNNTKGLLVKFNNFTAPYLANQEVGEVAHDMFLWSSDLMDGFVYSNMASANFGTIIPSSVSALACTVVVPFFATDTSTALSFDTLTDTLKLPRLAGPLTFFHDSGVVYDTIEYFGGPYDTIYRIHLDRDLGVKWTNAHCRWYLVHAVKVLDGFSGYSLAGVPFDTFVTDSQVMIPKEYVFQPDDSAYHADTSYSFLAIYVMAANGALPTERDSLPDLEKSGYLYGFSDVVEGDPTTEIFYPTKGAKRFSEGPNPSKPPRPSAQEILRKVLKKYAPNG